MYVDGGGGGGVMAPLRHTGLKYYSSQRLRNTKGSYQKEISYENKIRAVQTNMGWDPIFFLILAKHLYPSRPVWVTIVKLCQTFHRVQLHFLTWTMPGINPICRVGGNHAGQGLVGKENVEAEKLWGSPSTDHLISNFFKFEI